MLENRRKRFALEMLEAWKKILLVSANNKAGFEDLIKDRCFTIHEKGRMRKQLRECRGTNKEAIEVIRKYRAELKELGYREN